jgi:hypothetical protein
MNKQLTTILKNVKGAGQPSGYVFSDDGKQPYGDVKTAWWEALKKPGIVSFRVCAVGHAFRSRPGIAGADVKIIQNSWGMKTD